MEERRVLLAEWRDEGLISVEQEELILATEPDASPVRVRWVEVAAYAGTILAAIGVTAFAFGDDGFGGEPPWWRFTLVYLGFGAILFAFALALASRPWPLVASRVAGFLAAVGALAVFAGAAFLIFGVLDPHRASGLVIGVVAVVVGFGAYYISGMLLSQLVWHLGWLILILGGIVAVFGDEFDPFLSDTARAATLIGGILVLVLGVSWLIAGHVGLLRPTNTALFLGSWSALTGLSVTTAEALPGITDFASSTSAALLLGLGAVALAILGVVWHRTVLVAVGALVAVESVAAILFTNTESVVGIGVLLALVGAAALAYAWFASRPQLAAAAISPETAPIAGEAEEGTTDQGPVSD